MVIIADYYHVSCLMPIYLIYISNSHFELLIYTPKKQGSVIGRVLSPGWQERFGDHPARNAWDNAP